MYPTICSTIALCSKDSRTLNVFTICPFGCCLMWVMSAGYLGCNRTQFLWTPQQNELMLLHNRVHQFYFFCEFQKDEYGVCLPRVLEEDKNFFYFFCTTPWYTLALWSSPTLRISTDQEKNIFRFFSLKMCSFTSLEHSKNLNFWFFEFF